MTDTQTDPQVADNPERPDWLPEKFTDGAALAKSYGELESKLGELSERAKYVDTLEEHVGTLSAQVESLSAQQTQTRQTDYVSQLEAQLQSARDMGDTRAELAIWTNLQQAVVDQRLQQALPQVQSQFQAVSESQQNQIAQWANREMAARYGNAWEENRQKVGELIEASERMGVPLITEAALMNPELAVTALDNAFKIATHGNVQPAQDAAAAQAEAERARLLAAQTATGAGTRTLTGDEAKQEWDAIKGSYQRKYWE